MAWNLPDGCDWSYFDSIVNEVECPKCGDTWDQEIEKGWGYSTVTLECEQCDTTWTHVVVTHDGD